MRSAIPQIEQRIADLQALEVGTVTGWSDPRVMGLESKIENTLARGIPDYMWMARI
jgi:hypothetical protein